LKKVLIISYHFGYSGSAMSEYIKDRIIGFENNDYKVDLITSTFLSGRFDKKKTIKYIPSIGPTIFLREFFSSTRFFIIRRLLMLPLVLTIGMIIETIERLILKRVGEGYWSWSPLTTAVILYQRIFNKYDIVISSGGPSSAHLANALSSMFFLKKGIAELQDPLNGDGIGHNINSSNKLRKLEIFLSTHLKKIVHVSKSAYEVSVTKGFNIEKFTYYYPGSPSFELHGHNNITQNELVLFHLGSLYSTRNFEKLTKGLVNIKSNILSFKKIVVVNQGSVSNNTPLPKSSDFLIFKQFKTTDRISALNLASNSNFLLLIQHLDNRSKITFPYKVWDYLNLKKPIIALVNNSELKSLLKNLGHYVADINNQNEISEVLNRSFEDYSNGTISIKSNPWGFNKQIQDLIKMIE